MKRQTKEAIIREISKMAKGENGTLFVSDIDTLQRMFMWYSATVFNVKVKEAPVFTIAKPRNGDKPIYCTYSPDLQRIADKSATALLFTVNPDILGNTKAVAEAMCYACLHYLALLQGKQVARKKGLDFKALAEKHGLTAEKTDDANAGYEKISFTSELWQKVFPYAQAVTFNFEGIEKPENKDNKNDKKEYTFVHPNRFDYVKTDNKDLKLFVEHNGKVTEMDLDVDGTLMQQVKANRRERKRQNPDPTVRPSVHK